MTAADTTAGTTAAVLAAAERIRALGDSTPRAGRDPVNQPMINNWTEAIGDANPLYSDPAFAEQSVFGGPVAPPAMAQVWSMRGLHRVRAGDDPLGLMTEALDELGFTSVVATNSDQTYHRHVRPGEEITASSRLEDVVGPKKTGLGEGWFFTTRTLWRVGDEVVAEMVFRILKFRPPSADAPPEDAAPDAGPSGRIVDASAYAGGVLRPVISRDTAFYWEGAKAGELRIQRWGETLRHPPGPMDPGGDLRLVPDYVVSAGTGTVFSFVVHHHPQVPGKRLPFVVALVELDEGVRVLGELIDVDPAAVEIGMPVRAVFLRVDDDLTLPAWEAR
ncbi:bifunctional MaoC family dehydratase N-terminal/OB-fold nucleic acid binding domain-containing protein [Tsukamurella ocularis]|uniref:bifunctional MaoC family dehydratase N-terminal/OB-fold nucleic acid binding domain-containing protein n=1 Tax=Tsukamurella ocularis TaxID=1970234 RepID=UPI00216927F5|nr:OB-fold domain-containing protein [Tsukamurella ocularis]MCS3778939.1 putative OB-fold protein/acyl dehydratase [Tsukamurella ocularis]MCS3787441.1 putative OB-fold protein/acyl dehydratase [Tsukamurella ocularis]MCS3851622.1 putative OB-fold protein/acyl dehydratase [Tsukamurella ocularis]